jgi:hypothetical protein
MANQYSQLTSELATALEGLKLHPYGWPSTLVISRRMYKEAQLPDFTRYCIIISPPGNPWEERRMAVPKVHFFFHVDLYLLVKNYDETSALFGESLPDLGLFQLVNDVKVLLRIDDLGGMLTRSTKSYDEPGGPLNFHYFTGGFDSGEKSFVFRAKQPYVTELPQDCHPRLS